MATDNNNGSGTRPQQRQQQAARQEAARMKAPAGRPATGAGAPRQAAGPAGRPTGKGGGRFGGLAGKAGSGKPGSGSKGAAAAGKAGIAAPAGKGGPGQSGGLGGSSSRRTTIIVVAGVVVAALAVWLLVWLFACNGNSLLDSSARDGQAPYKSDAEMQAELDRQVEEGMFNISIASVIQFDDGTAPGTAYIENVPGNHYNMQVTITQDDTGDVLYESGVLKPNQFIEQIALAKDLDAGSYAATATFTALDESTYDEIGKAAAKVTINVLG